MTSDELSRLASTEATYLENFYETKNTVWEFPHPIESEVILMTVGDGGPYVQAASFCETIIRGKETGRLSMINIIDGIAVVGADPDEMPSVSLANLKIVVNLWAGQAKGRYTLKLRPEEPSGMQGDMINLGSLNFSTQPGIDTIVPMPPFEVGEEGKYWFDVILSPGRDEEDRLLSRIPLTVSYQPQVAQG